MPSLKDLQAQRVEGSKHIGIRTPIARVLFLLGIFIVFLVLGVLSLTPVLEMQPLIPLSLAAVTFIIFIVLAIHYKKKQTAEQVKKRLDPKSLLGSIILTCVLLAFIFVGLSFFLRLAMINPFGWTGEQRGTLAISLVFGVVLYFAATPFIMALWYKVSPKTACFIIKLHKLFYWKGKDRISDIFVLDQPQEHSFRVLIYRAFNALIFSIFMTFAGVIPVLGLLENIGIDPLFGLGIVNPASVSGLSDPDFVRYCAGYFLNLTLPVILSFIVFFWALPPTYLMDDAGIVFFRKYTKRRQPAEMRTVSSWFLGLVKAVLGTSALYQYIFFVIQNIKIINIVANGAGAFAAVEFTLFILGFPVFGTILMAFMLLIFQESQFNKMKTFLYQELINIKIDPRVVTIDLERKDSLQDKTLLDYWGENFFHNPPLRDSVTGLGAAGPIKPGKDS